jgi:hypothetical protein
MTENGVAAAAPDDDRTPTQADAPMTKPAGEWVMPEPVFRRSEGYTPTLAALGNEDETLTPDTLEPADFEMREETDAEQEIGQQPEVSEAAKAEISAAPTVAVPAKKNGRFLKVLFIILGIVLAILAAAALFVALGLGYLFRISESQNLN